MTLEQASILGIVEGLTEFLPVSSTAHLIIFQHLMGMPETEALKTFDISIQLGAILAAFTSVGSTLLRKEKNMFWTVFVGFLPTGIIGLLLYSWVKAHLLGNLTVVAWALLLGGIALIAFEWWIKGRRATVTDMHKIGMKASAGIGTFQALALVPGVSRSAATIVGGMLLGIDRTTIVKFSFLLAIPTMAAATGLDMVKSFDSLSLSMLPSFITGFVVSYGTAKIAMHWLLKYVQTHTFIAFGIYRIVLATIILSVL